MGGPRTHQTSIRIDAPPERVWALVSDVRNMGRWSPICRRCEWTDGAQGPAPGARFKGYNRLWGWRWSRECVVDEAVPGRVFAFHTIHRGRDSVHWRYAFTPDGEGTRVEESYEIEREPLYLRMMPHIAGVFRRASNRGMDTTLRAVKEAAEAEQRARVS